MTYKYIYGLSVFFILAAFFMLALDYSHGSMTLTPLNASATFTLFSILAGAVARILKKQEQRIEHLERLTSSQQPPAE
jgi:hypothetical protein